jgi:hypothetical protein
MPLRIDFELLTTFSIVLGALAEIARCWVNNSYR